ncbi:MAG: tetratricopeptide repeat protein [Acidobacteriia bacterium]|nr:tetratricopeptide repeat protein [Terriglobia bacterium]
MKYQLFCCALLTLSLSFSPSSASAQGRGGGAKGTPQKSQTPVGDFPLGNVFLSGKVVIDDGTPLTERAAIQTVCKGQKHNETYTDSHGQFSFEFVTRSSAKTGNSAGIMDADSSWTNPTTVLMTPTSILGTQRDWKDCQLQAVLPGFTSDAVELSMISPFDHNDLGRIVLHRIEQIQGTTISATSAAAPGAAKKAFEKGRDQEKKSKWDEAQQDFEKAVQVYPSYAVAWYELGRMQAQKKDIAGAGHSFDQALAADPKFASPYQGLAELAFHARQWQQVVTLTEKLLALNPVNFPDAWFFNSVGNYFLQNLEVAEKSARQGIRTDEQHTIPKLEYVLGMILMEKRNYQEAGVHMQQYLHLVHNPADVDEAQKQLAQITRLSTTASVPAVVEKK